MSPKAKDNLSPRKRSPRKQIRWPNQKKKKQTNFQSQINQSTEQQTLHHFFGRQREKIKNDKLLLTKGSRDEPMIIDDANDDQSEQSSFISNDRKVVRNLFSSCSSSLNSQETNSQQNQSETSQSTTVSQSTVVISPLKEPNIDFSQDDTDEIMGSLPDVNLEPKRSWTPESFTFETLLKKVQQLDLLCGDDLDLLDRFQKLNRSTQEICLRLYQRKHSWILRSKILYRIDDVDKCLRDAVEANFLWDKSKLTDIETMLERLPLKDALTLGRQFCDVKISTKAGAIEALLAHANRKDVLFGTQRIRQSILKSGQDLLEECYYVVPAFVECVTRVLTLYSLGSHFDTFTAPADRNDHGCCLIFTISRYLNGTFTFPEHESANPFELLFKTPEQFRLYSDARYRQFHLSRLMALYKFDEAMKKFEEHYDWFVNNYSADRFKEDAQWPQFLHRFTFTYSFLKFLTIGAEICERHKKYNEAIDLYFAVLSQTSFMQNRRGFFWNRLLLDVDAHLKKPHNSLALAHIALQDSIFNQQKFDIYTRAERLSKRFKVKTYFPKFVIAVEAPIENISGQLMQRTIIGRKNVFASIDATGERVVGPEAVAIEHYLNNGFTRGVHGETPSMLMLFALLSWEIIFGCPTEESPKRPSPSIVALTRAKESDAIRQVFSIDLENENSEEGTSKGKRKRQVKKSKKLQEPVMPLEHKSRYYDSVEFPTQVALSEEEATQTTVYVSDFQSGPMDLGYAEFYLNRKNAIHDHLEKIAQMSHEEIVSLAMGNYEQQFEKLNPFFDWRVLTKEEVETLLPCIPVKVLVGIFRQLLVDFRFYRSGFPDVIMWNESKRIWKVIEVKGPGDVLSTKQRYWMHLLRSLDVDCVTCRVASVHQKRVRTQQSDE